MISQNHREQNTIREVETANLRRLLRPSAWALALVMMTTVTVAGLPRSAEACGRSTPPPMSCERSLALTKATFISAKPPSGTLQNDVFVTVITDSGKTKDQPFACASPSTGLVHPESVISVLAIEAFPPPTQSPAVLTGTLALPAIPAGFQKTGFNVPLTFVQAHRKGLYLVEGTVGVRFSTDSGGNPEVTQELTGDTVMCLADPAPSNPGIPRLDIELVSPGAPSCAAGIQRKMGVVITNNDDTESVSVRLTVTSAQGSHLGTLDESDGFYSFSSPDDGDDFPIAFAEDCPASGILPLPADPMTYTQLPISKDIILAPGASIMKEIVSNSYGPCLDGSCSEFTFVAQGNFLGGDPAVACLGGGLVVVSASDCPEAIDPVACCAPDNSCTDDLPEDCVAGGGTPLGAYSVCTGDGPPDTTCVVPDPVSPARACCFEDGSCQDVDPDTCQSDDQNLGTPQLAGSVCASTQCAVLGACCHAPGTTAVVLTEAICDSTVGLYLGDGTDASAVCPAGNGACCFPPDPTALMTYEASCLSQGGVYQGDGSSPVCQLAVSLAAFTGEATDDGVVLSWSTEAEIDNEGFSVRRSTSSDGDFQVVGTGLIPAEGGPAFGADYQLVDADVDAGVTYYYVLDDIDTAGTVETHGAGPCTFGVNLGCEPVSVTFGISAAEFCGSHEIGSQSSSKGRDERACREADWQDNEGRHPRDCRVNKGGTRTCVATEDAN